MNPIVLELPAPQVSHGLLVELCQQRHDPLRAAATDSPHIKLLRPSTFVFQPGKRFRVRQVDSWDVSEVDRKLVQITLNPHCMHSLN
jgi:hypothetical protein